MNCIVRLDICVALNNEKYLTRKVERMDTRWWIRDSEITL